MLDLVVDWIGVVLIGLGFMIYADRSLKILGLCVRCALWSRNYHCTASL